MPEFETCLKHTKPVCRVLTGQWRVLTEELLVLVRGNVILCEELTSEGHVRCAVILACTFFWRSVLTSKTASILWWEKKLHFYFILSWKNRAWEELLFHRELWMHNMLTCAQSAPWALSIVWGASGEDRHRRPRYPPVTPAREVWPQLWKEKINKINHWSLNHGLRLDLYFRDGARP